MDQLSPAPLSSLDRAAVGAPITRVGVSLIPIYICERLAGPVVTGPDSGVEIAEADSANVPSLTVTNPVDKPVLLVEGQLVAGGLQHRTINVSVLVPPKSRLDVPVSCVEAGRWSGGGRFRSAGQVSRRVRRAKTDSVARALRDAPTGTRARYSDQGAVWESVSEELLRLDVDSPTACFMAVDDAFALRDELSDAVDELDDLGPLPGQCGVVVAHGRRIVAVDVFANSELFAEHWATITRSAILDAPDEVEGRPSISTALRFVRRLAVMGAVEVEGIGLGRERHVRTNRTVAQALIWDAALVHASAFALAA